MKNQNPIEVKNLVLCPLSVEKKHFVRAFNLHTSELKIDDLHADYIADLGLVVIQGGHGKVQFALQTQYVLQRIPQIENVICAGSAGALTEHVQNLDLVIGASTIEHDYNMKLIKKDLPNFQAAPDLLKNFLMIDGNKLGLKGRIHSGPIASGDEDVIDPLRAQEIHANTNALAVAWEGAGGAKACRFLRKNYIELRGITDASDQNTFQDFEKNIQAVMTDLAKLVHEVLRVK